MALTASSSQDDATPVFQNIEIKNTNRSISSGFYHLRELGDTNYEVIDLNAAAEVFTSAETGREMAAIPARLAAIESLKAQLEDLKYKLEQGIASAGKLF